jgi:hypothetical protein
MRRKALGNLVLLPVERVRRMGVIQKSELTQDSYERILFAFLFTLWLLLLLCYSSCSCHGYPSPSTKQQLQDLFRLLVLHEERR